MTISIEEPKEHISLATHYLDQALLDFDNLMKKEKKDDYEMLEVVARILAFLSHQWNHSDHKQIIKLDHFNDEHMQKVKKTHGYNLFFTVISVMLPVGFALLGAGAALGPMFSSASKVATFAKVPFHPVGSALDGVGKWHESKNSAVRVEEEHYYRLSQSREDQFKKFRQQSQEMTSRFAQLQTQAGEMRGRTISEINSAR